MPREAKLRQFCQIRAGQFRFAGQFWQDSQASSGCAGPVPIREKSRVSG